MPLIQAIRPVLLTAPYADGDNGEVAYHLPHGHRTCGLVEVTLDNGVTGLGEGYLAVFAPHVFTQIAALITPHLLGREASEMGRRYRDMCQVCDYWSLQGAARHVISAIEMALADAVAKSAGVPAYQLFGGRLVDDLRLYGSGGDSLHPAAMERELDLLGRLGISLFKIRARHHQAAKAAWVMEAAGRRGIKVGIDMTQNLAHPAQTVGEVVRFVQQLEETTGGRIAFLEEMLGPFDIDSYPVLRGKISTLLAGGEIVTTARELCERVEKKIYDWVQPDATVLGGIAQVLEVFTACRQHGSQAVVHCWGGAVCMMANYHAAFAGGGVLAEWPMPRYPLREALMVEPLRIAGGRLRAPSAPGLGVLLTPELEHRFAFREEAIYHCHTVGKPPPDDSVWRSSQP